ncbi:HlyD family secretion protein [Brockia lithotrophica]|uniref:CusB/HlyD membrane fusion family barrel-sandwich protein n=1 Tax=Brockia lithotrophica TaxID=933949 RepID=A0A660L4X8_9BACL|nr:efflux RND transporter periplasmic adaptor subunit [Brockia lithotrophica]RKQ88987.1 CusB/HlyD membrane fusion family barrel-sandwich protein [Brockia lithotrophica]
MSKSWAKVAWTVAILLTLAVAVVGAYYGIHLYKERSTYVLVKDAKVDGTKITIVAPQNGKLVEFTAEVGKTYKAGDVLGYVCFPQQTPGAGAAGAPGTVQSGAPTSGGTQSPSGAPSGGAQPGAPRASGQPGAAQSSTSGASGQAAGEVARVRVPITMPQDGTIVLRSQEEGSLVGAGTPLAYAFDFSKLYVRALVSEADYPDVAVGNDVEVWLTAYPGTKLQGKVVEKGLYTEGMFSLLPTLPGTGETSEKLPVRIELSSVPQDVQLVPGLSATVKIARSR